MSCEHVKDLLSAYLDNMLAMEEQEHVTVHLQGCAVCQSILADFRHFDALIVQLPRIVPNHTLRNGIFCSEEYRALTGAPDRRGRHRREVTLTPQSRRRAARRPQPFTAGGHRNMSTVRTLRYYDRTPLYQCQVERSIPEMRSIRMVLAVAIFLSFGIGGLIGWRLRQISPEFLHHRYFDPKKDNNLPPHAL